MSPHHEIERWQIGRLVVGVDEAGRGALAGPVAAAAVVFPSYGFPEGLNDSKALTAEQRVVAAQTLKVACQDDVVGPVGLKRRDLRIDSGCHRIHHHSFW